MRMAALEAECVPSLSRQDRRCRMTVLSLLRQGDEIVAPASYMEGRSAAFSNTLPRWGIKTHFVTDDLAGFARHLDRSKLSTRYHRNPRVVCLIRGPCGHRTSSETAAGHR